VPNPVVGRRLSEKLELTRAANEMSSIIIGIEGLDEQQDAGWADPDRRTITAQFQFASDGSCNAEPSAGFSTQKNVHAWTSSSRRSMDIVVPACRPRVIEFLAPHGQSDRRRDRFGERGLFDGRL
jgi:hypothetical protein